MMLRKILLAACAAALATTPAWAQPGRGQSGEHGNSGDAPAQHHGHPHRCVAHRVAYVAAGAIVRQSLALDGSGQPGPTVATTSAAGRGARPTVSGDVTIDVKRTNRHARADRGTQKTYALDHARLLLALPDQNGDGSVDLGDVAPGSRAKVIGSTTVLAPRCDQTGFTPTLRIAKLIVHAPPAS